MKFTLPEEYRDHFTSEKIWLSLKNPEDSDGCDVRNFKPLFISRWKDGALLLLNGEQRKRMKESMGVLGSEQPHLRGITRFVDLGIVPTTLNEQGEFDVPEHILIGMMNTEVEYLRLEEVGIIMKAKK